MPEAVKREKNRIRIHTSLYKIEGEVTVHEGYRGRLSDILNDPKPFLAIINAEVYSIEKGTLLYKSNFICVNKQIMSMVIPIEE